MQNLYGITLNASTSNPFKVYESDLKVESETAPAIEEPKKKSKKKDEPVEKVSTINLDGIQDRIFEIPTPSGNYFGVYAFEKKLYYSRTSASSPAKLYSFEFESKTEEEVGTVGRYKISNDGKKIMGTKGKDYFITKLEKKVELKEGKLDLDKMQITLDRKAEWKQIFDEAWRQMKYFFYDPNMHGVDWLAIKKRYEPLVPFVNHRSDLTYLIGEMIGELDVGHAYVGGGDMPKVDEVKMGLLGARYEFVPTYGLYKFSKILEGRNWDESTRSPLTEPGINIKVGDYLIAIDDNLLSETDPPNELLNNKANAYVKITYNSKPSKEGAQDVWVKTIANESKLLYYNWVEKNRRYVEKVTNGRIGYIHIPDMGFDNGLNEFVKYFYPQLDKEGLIIDDRYNGGGNVSSMIAERLRREVAVARNARNQTNIGSTPGAVMPGPYVCLVNQQSMSDGDLFPYQFRKYGLGKIIGKRTWGGVIGIRGSLPFTDGSNLSKPEFANFGPNGEWILEDVGIYPDIEIENDPYKEYMGTDEQLDKAIEVILEDIKTNKKQQLPKSMPPYPKK
jgi:tricorn protease